MESRGYKLSMSKTEYMKCKFSTNEIMRGTIKIEEKKSLLVDVLNTLGPYL